MCRPNQYNKICWELDLISGFFADSVFFAGFLDCLSGWNPPCRRLRILTQGLAPDPKCKLNISSFISIAHLLDCLLCARNFMSIVLLLQMTGDGISWEWLIYLRMWVGGFLTFTVTLFR